LQEQLPAVTPGAIAIAIATRQRVEPILELEIGPELQLNLDENRPNLTLSLRLRGTYTQLGPDSLFGLGAGAGIEF
jgi:hypothetical protein